MMLSRRASLTVIAVALAVTANSASATDPGEARVIVEKARLTFNQVIKTKEFDSLRAGLKQAKGVLIYPQVLKAGFFLGGSGGTGVLLARGNNNDWSNPAFYHMGSVSFGVQFGGQDSAIVILINSQKAVDGLMASSIKLGGDVSAAVGPVGAGQAANLTADFVSYSKAKGAFVGMSVEGSVLEVSGDLNNTYYGKDVTPIDIVSKRSVANKQADALRKAVALASK
jgi:lipid-binding SYLF domain-containing protein